jgi:branched-chain amino acid transport system ATP-binding protein
MLLEVNDLNVYYGAIHALQGISFHVEKGEIVTLIGANGAGKSTTLNSISGIVRARGGSIKFKGEEITKTPAYDIVKMGVVQVPEGRQIFAPLTVKENLDMGAFTRSDPKGIKKSLERVYKSFPRLKERLDQYGRWRAADVGHGTGPDVRARVAPVRRAIDGPGSFAGG